eukprot:CAMPEP_0168528706 /NCGR_PEP_ID=MMETSP0405-20121227/13418_1 /TAXON_ID=498012 /ORGANISM="Trichosphaerium sp, Strain Am-I-7 wt" /LENGTH=186 /DNA_ID=CAMNT_0008552181 /DNA_START=16 /DNA_END=576 /DNA_ORIENTATION=-
MGGAVHSRILVLGIDGAGKTTFLHKYMNPKQDISVEPTEAYKIYNLKVKGVKFNVWDISGKESTRSLWKYYYSQDNVPDAVIWVVDAADEERLEESKKELSKAMRDPNLAGVLVFVIANKQDIDGAKTDSEIGEALDVQSYSSSRTAICAAISAKTGDGIREALEELADKIKLNLKEKKGDETPAA